MEAFADLPGPIPSFPFGTAMELKAGGKQVWEVSAEYGDRYGGMTRVWLGSKPAVMLNDPDAIEKVLVSDMASYEKNAPAILENLCSDQFVFIANGSSWQKKRAGDPMSADFSPEWIESQIAPMRSTIEGHVQSFISATENAEAEVLSRLQRMTFDAFSTACIGQTLDDRMFELFLKLAQLSSDRFSGKKPLWFTGFSRLQREWMGAFEALVDERRASPRLEAQDLLSRTLCGESSLSPHALPSVFANIFYGGVFSATSVILTSLYFLTRNPQHEQRLVEELLRLHGETPDYALSELKGAVVLDSVLRESMRVMPPVPFYGRTVAAEDGVTLGGHHLPKGTGLLISNYWLQRHSPRWARGKEFDPKRWEGSTVAENPIGSGHFFPFGRGPRMCVGTEFAMSFMKVALATLIHQSHCDVGREQDYVQEFFFGVMVPKGLRARFARR